MSDASFEERLAAVERALTEEDGGSPDSTVSNQDLADRVGALEEDVVELEAAVEAVRGYVGSVKHVNDDVEKRADAAMAKAEALEQALADDEDDRGGGSNMDDSGERTASGPSDCIRDSGRNSEREPFVGRHDDRIQSRSEERDTEPKHGARSMQDPGHETGNGIERSNEAPRSPTEYERSGSSGGGSDGEHRRTSDAGSDCIGHRHLAGSDGVDGSDEPDGLLARLREVL